MQTLLLLVDDTCIETLKHSLPADKAWVLDERYDRFRSQMYCALDAYLHETGAFISLEHSILSMEQWLEEGPA